MVSQLKGIDFQIDVTPTVSYILAICTFSEFIYIFAIYAYVLYLKCFNTSDKF